MNKEKIAIIGAGLAGCLLAAKLKAFAQVTLYERGKKRGAADGKLVALGQPLGMRTMSYGMGGTTNVWRGCMLGMRPDEFKNEHWPTAVRIELSRHGDEVLRMLCSKGYSAYLDRRVDPGDAFPTDEIIVPTSPPRLRCSGLFSGTETRPNRLVRYVEELESKVVVYSTDGKNTYKEVFDRVVISSGGLNSPLLLRRSSLGGTLVAKNLTDHPAGFVAKVSVESGCSTLAGLDQKDGKKPVIKIMDPETKLWSMFQLCPTRDLCFSDDPYLDSYRVGYAARLKKAFERVSLPDFGEHFGNLATARAKSPRMRIQASVLLFAEQEATGQGEVSEDKLGVVHVDWRCSQQVVAAAERSLSVFASQLGAKLHRPPYPMVDTLWSAAHHSGGCRLSNDPTTGVVDANLRVHETRRIFVCDGSVMPSTGATNTGLTIGAMALRLAEHMRQSS